MSKDDDYLGIFSMKTGMFATCSGVWDESTKKYRSSDSTEVVQCCNKKCIEPVKFCHDYCNKEIAKLGPKKLSSCLLTCNDQRNICLDTCSLSSPYMGVNNNYNLCAKAQGCEVSNELQNLQNIDCVRKHKDVIFDCCRRTCLPQKDLDCQKHCEFLQKVTLDPSKIGVPKVSQQKLKALSQSYKTYHENTSIYILVGVVISIIVIAIWLFWQKRKRI